MTSQTTMCLTASQLAWLAGGYMEMCRRLDLKPVDIDYWARQTYSGWSR